MINGSTKIYGIMGNPVKHSLSPRMHNRAFEELGENSVYLPFCVEDVPAAIKGMKAIGIQGVSVTIPHKESVFDHLQCIAQCQGQIRHRKKIFWVIMNYMFLNIVLSEGRAMIVLYKTPENKNANIY